MFFLAIIPAVIIYRLVVPAIKHLVYGITEISEGNLEHSFHLGGSKEFSFIADAMNIMIGEIKNSIETIRDSKNALEKSESHLRSEMNFTDKILNTQKDTFFLFDPSNGKAIRWNQSFKDISGYTDQEIQKMKAPDAYYSQTD